MTRRTLILLAACGSLALLLGAWGFQHLGGLAPCKMCIWQRWPHGVAAGIGLLTLVTGLRWLPWLGAAAALTTALVGLYHVGVEQGWWDGPSTCTSGSVSDISAEDLLARIMEAPLVRCDDIAWSFAGLSMAGWNAVMSLILVGVWIAAARRA